MFVREQSEVTAERRVRPGGRVPRATVMSSASNEVAEQVHGTMPGVPRRSANVAFLRSNSTKLSPNDSPKVNPTTSV